MNNEIKYQLQSNEYATLHFFLSHLEESISNITFDKMIQFISEEKECGLISRLPILQKLLSYNESDEMDQKVIKYNLAMQYCILILKYGRKMN